MQICTWHDTENKKYIYVSGEAQNGVLNGKFASVWFAPAILGRYGFRCVEKRGAGSRKNGLLLSVTCEYS